MTARIGVMHHVAGEPGMSAAHYRVVQAPIGWVPRALLVLGAVLLFVSLLVSLWDMTMFAPQYQDGLRLHIYASKLVGGNGGQDLKEINLLNHYIGMHELSQGSFTEFLWMPFVLGGLGLLLLRASFFGTVAHVIDVTVLFAWAGLFCAWSFAHKLWLYGHELSPNAPVKVPPFMPPVFGRSQLANFEVYSYPGPGAYVLLAGAAAMAVALVLAIRSSSRRGAATGG